MVPLKMYFNNSNRYDHRTEVQFISKDKSSEREYRFRFGRINCNIWQFYSEAIITKQLEWTDTQPNGNGRYKERNPRFRWVLYKLKTQIKHKRNFIKNSQIT